METTPDETVELHEEMHESLKSWSQAEPNLPPEIVDWDHLIGRITGGEDQADQSNLVSAVASRHKVPVTKVRDTISEAISIGILEELPQEQITITTRNQGSHNE